ncbi:hypothetical protein B0T21DRAFT_54836 [Apiosordaria backusii]|uniref:Uncharacterized protein n=1 Tax=Apiosordaria backusii TaxID=314023 RepID=A0AA40AMS7_9PEZI|nr:hypothetical protein B0T21DRAFT_54836 [Apiosordaria backusii]
MTMVEPNPLPALLLWLMINTLSRFSRNSPKRTSTIYSAPSTQSSDIAIFITSPIESSGTRSPHMLLVFFGTNSHYQFPNNSVAIDSRTSPH